MLLVKKLLTKILLKLKYVPEFTWDTNTNNTTNTWVPVINGNKMEHRVIPRNIITAQQVQTTINKAFGSHVSITAPTVSEYTFVAWIGVTTSGWVGACEINGVMSTTCEVWNATSGQSGTGTIYATALYKANF